MAKHNSIVITKKDGEVIDLKGWKADAVTVSLWAVLGASVYILGKTTMEYGNKVIASVKK